LVEHFHKEGVVFAAQRAPGKNRAIAKPEASEPADAATVAADQVATVRDSPAARLGLAGASYEDPGGRSARHLPYRRAALSFMHWEARRGVLNALDATPPGSRWWRAMNERLIRDGYEAAVRTRGHGGPRSSATIEAWDSFIASPTPGAWYRAHNASVAAAYLEHRDLAESESRTERFFLNVVLSRVLYAHALVAAPHLALGRLAAIGRPLGDPRLGMAGVFLSMGRVLPDRYPAEGDLENYLRIERGFGRVLDFAVIQPRLQNIYEWSAKELDLPGVAQLAVDSIPAYAWSPDESREWRSPPLSRVARLIRTTTAPS
jgi:hypothetical protein